MPAIPPESDVSPSVPRGGLVTFVVSEVGVLENVDLQTLTSLSLLKHEIEIVEEGSRVARLNRQFYFIATVVLLLF